MDIESIHEFTMNLGEVEETQPFGLDNIVYKINNKMFLLLATDEIPLRFNVKCNPELALELREEYSSVIPGYHMNKKHWNTIVVDGNIPTAKLKEFIQHSFELVRGKK
ncbi:MAG: MmcQ/YjbR family DNA-binding protein [Chitinophagaceae bacterium]|nr:MmcQ/YjbR family DNA-binding protein [Chitinophagaceae bacterium]